MKDSLKSIADSDQKILDNMQEQLKHDARAFGAIRVLNILRQASQAAAILTPDMDAMISNLSKMTDYKELYAKDLKEIFLFPVVIAYKCPRCKWKGSATELTPITKDGETAIDYADGSPIHGCPKCGEHKLTEI